MTPADLLHVRLVAEGICVGPMFICARSAGKYDGLSYANEPLGATGALPLHLGGTALSATAAPSAL